MLRWLAVRVCCALLVCGVVRAQAGKCECGTNPPPKPANRVLEPYALEPADMRPFSNFTKPYHEHYTKLVEYYGGARDAKTVAAADVMDVPIAFLGPVRNHKDEKLGTAMLRGAEMALHEANAGGGYGGKPFRLVIHNDEAVWGASSNEIVKMTYDDQAWAMLGSISSDSTHIALRVSLRSELPMVNSASTDPTIPETTIPWILTSIQDDRAQCFTLARHIYTELGLKRIALLRVNERYGRFGVGKFKDASRRLGHPLIIEQKYMPGDTDFRRQLRVINDSRVDGIVTWGDAVPTGLILKQMRDMGMKQPVFGSHRTIGPELFQIAGAAAEGFKAVYPFDPTRDDAAWVDFQKRFRAKYNADVDSFSALAFDTMNILLNAICRAGLNRGAIRDALYSYERYKGVTGEMIFDPNAKNIAPMYLATVKDGKLEFRRATMDAAYAATSDSGPTYGGPPLPDSKAVIAVIGPQATERVRNLRANEFVVVGIDSDAAWGKASTNLVKAVYEGEALAIIATDRASAHLAEQIGSKTFVPVIALSADTTLTSTNVPWIFRAPSDWGIERAVSEIKAAARTGGTNRATVRDALSASGKFTATGEPALASH
jgi:ABC-type branched-subunit amino acid transport system substrate-binding protein